MPDVRKKPQKVRLHRFRPYPAYKDSGLDGYTYFSNCPRDCAARPRRHGGVYPDDVRFAAIESQTSPNDPGRRLVAFLDQRDTPS